MKEAVMEALCAMRPPFVLYEADLHAIVEQSFTQRNLPYAHEVSIGRGCRIDYVIGNVGVEIKKGKPNRTQLLRQVERYAACERIGEIIVVSWQSVALPKEVYGKPVHMLSLSALWGVSLP